jgi:hypothetical protein
MATKPTRRPVLNEEKRVASKRQAGKARSVFSPDKVVRILQSVRVPDEALQGRLRALRTLERATITASATPEKRR